MTTTYSDSLRLAEQGFNDNVNTWGTVLNDQLVILDKAVAGVTTLNVTGSVTYDLGTSATDGFDSLSKRAILKLTGIPTALCSITVPAVTKIYAVHASLGAVQNVFIHPTGSSVGVTVGPSDKVMIYCDGTDMIRLMDFIDQSNVMFKTDNLSSIANTSIALNNLGITASASELNILDGVTVCAAEINYLGDVTSSVQAQIDNLTSVISSVSAAITAGVSAQVTSVLTNILGFNAYFESAETTISLATIVSVDHNLGSVPTLVMPEIVCKITDAGYAVGDRLPIHCMYQFEDQPIMAFYNATGVGIVFTDNAPFRVMSKTNGSRTTITFANWKVVIRAWA